MRTSSRLLALALAFPAVLLLVGCGGRGARPARPSAIAVFADARPVTSPVLAWLPPDASMVVIVDRIDRLARELGWDQVARLQPEAHARAVAAMDELFGHDLLDPGKLGEVGLDATRPAGVAYLDPETLVIFLPLTDPARFEHAVMRQAPLWNQAVTARAAGTARILGPPYEDVWRIVLRERAAMWILAVDDTRARAAAQTLATAGGPGLARHPAFVRAMHELAYGADVAGYVSGALLAAGGDELGLAADAGLAFGLDLGRDGIRLRASVPVEPGGLLDRLLRTPERTPALLGALTQRPLALFDTVVDGQALAELRSASQLGAALEAMTGLSFARDLAPLLAGEIGAAVVPGPGTGEPGSKPVVHVVAALRDPAQGQALLERALAAGPLAGRTQPSGSGAYRVAGPGGAVVHVGVSGRYLFASTGWSPETLPVLGTGSAPALAQALGKGTLALLLLGPGQAAARASIDARLLGDWFLIGQVDTSFVASRLAELERGYQPSEAFRRKRAELEVAQRELVALESTAVARTTERTRALLDAAGTFALRVDLDRRADRARLVVHGAEIAGPDGMPALIGQIFVALALRPPPEPEAEALNQARARVWRILDELAEIRRSETGEPAPGPEPEPGMPPTP